MESADVKDFGSIEEILEFAVNEEKDAEQFYLEASKKASDPDLKQFLKKLAAMEREHFLILQAKLEECRATNFSCKGILDSFGS